MNSNKKVDLSVIIINYNGEKFIKRCLDSVLESKSKYVFEIIVIDNNSKDNSKETLSQYKAKIKLIENQENMGFAKANNQAIPYCEGEHILLLNNDTVVDNQALEKMIDYYIDNPNTGALSAKLLNPDGTIQTQGSILGAWRFRSRVPRRVPFISGAALMTKKEIYQKIGGLDEQLFFYNEDLVFCKELSKNKSSIVYLPQARVIHFKGLSTKTRKAEAIIDGYKGSLYLSKKYYPRFIHYVHRILLFVYLIPKLIFYKSLTIFNKKQTSYYQAYKTILKTNFFGE